MSANHTPEHTRTAHFDKLFDADFLNEMDESVMPGIDRSEVTAAVPGWQSLMAPNCIMHDKSTVIRIPKHRYDDIPPLAGGMHH